MKSIPISFERHRAVGGGEIVEFVDMEPLRARRISIDGGGEGKWPRNCVAIEVGNVSSFEYRVTRMVME